MAEPVTILHVRNSIAYGGVETSMLGWLNGVDKTRFHCPIALFSERNGAEVAFQKPFAANCHQILSIPWHPGRQFRQAIKTLEHHIRETNAKLLHTHDWRSDVVGWHAAKRTGIPIMTTVYVWFHKPLATRIKEAIDCHYIRKFDRVTAVCDATRQQTVARGIPEEKSQVLISGIDSNRAAVNVDSKAVRAHFGISESDTVFVYVARFYREKAHATLVEAFAEIAAKESNVRLLLLGTGPLEEAIKNQVTAAGLSDKILMPGFVEDIPTILAAVDVMVHASLAEGISLALYEGMLAGLPVIGSNVDGTPEVVIPERTGWLVPPGDISALRQKLEEALLQKERRQEYGRNAKALILNNYSMEQAVSQLQNCWQSLLPVPNDDSV